MAELSSSRKSIDIETEDRDRLAGFHPVSVILDNLRSAYNVGNIFRLAEVCRIKEIITCGYTATPPHPKLRKTARGCDELVKHRHYPNAVDIVEEFNHSGVQTIAIETVTDAACIWDVDFRFPAALVFGNEAMGISREALECCTLHARLPVYGRKNSLNVANCAAVAVYAAIRQLTNKESVNGL